MLVCLSALSLSPALTLIVDENTREHLRIFRVHLVDMVCTAAKKILKIHRTCVLDLQLCRLFNNYVKQRRPRRWAEKFSHFIKFSDTSQKRLATWVERGLFFHDNNGKVRPYGKSLCMEFVNFILRVSIPITYIRMLVFQWRGMLIIWVPLSLMTWINLCTKNPITTENGTQWMNKLINFLAFLQRTKEQCWISEKHFFILFSRLQSLQYLHTNYSFQSKIISLFWLTIRVGIRICIWSFDDVQCWSCSLLAAPACRQKQIAFFYVSICHLCWLHELFSSFFIHSCLIFSVIERKLLAQSSSAAWWWM